MAEKSVEVKIQSIDTSQIETDRDQNEQGNLEQNL